MISQIQKIGMLAVLILSTFLPAYSNFIWVGELGYDVLPDGRTLSVARLAWSRDPLPTDIIIPERVRYNGRTYLVVGISKDAFSGCSSLTSVTIPNSVTTIGGYAFYGCTSLTSLTIPNSVTEIGREAFDGCSSLSAINVETDNLSYASLDGVLFSKNVDTLLIYPEGKQSMCYDIPDSVTTISKYAFSGCNSLTAVTIPNSVTTIGEDAFCECSSLTAVTIPNSVTTIGKHAFLWCNSLIAVTIPNSVTTIGEAAFSYCSSLTAVTIPNSVTTIGGNAFLGCSSLTSVTIPNSVTTISKNAFLGCSSLTAVTIPNSVTTISEYAFEDCSSLTAVTIPNSVTTIGGGAFLDTPLREINCEITDPIKCNPGFSTTVLDEATLYVPMGTLKKYQNCDPWRDFWNIVEKDFNAVGSVPSEEVSVTVQDGCICVDGVRSNVEIYVYDLQGNNVYSGFATRIADLAKGFYIVTVGKTSVKVQLH